MKVLRIVLLSLSIYWRLAINSSSRRSLPMIRRILMLILRFFIVHSFTSSHPKHKNIRNFIYRFHLFIFLIDNKVLC